MSTCLRTSLEINDTFHTNSFGTDCCESSVHINKQTRIHLMDEDILIGGYILIQSLS